MELALLLVPVVLFLLVKGAWDRIKSSFELFIALVLVVVIGAAVLLG